MTRFWTCLLAAIVLMGAAQSADAFRTKDGMLAQSDPSRNGVFETFAKSGAGTSEYWCAAGDFALRKLHVPVATRLYVVRGPGRSNIDPSRKSVVFTYSPSQDILNAAASAGGVSASVTTVGYNMRAAQGQSLCGKKRDRDR